MSSGTKITLMEPESQPVLGLRSAPHPTTLRPGFYQELKNVRIAQGCISVRAGSTRISTTTITGATVVASGVYEWGSQLVAVAVADTGASDWRVYYQIYNGSTWGSWSEASASSGPYGNTRLTKTDQPPVLVPIPGYYGVRDVVIQNGTDRPRVLRLGSTSLTVIPSAVANPDASQYSPVACVNGVLSTADKESVDLTVASSGISVAFSVAGSIGSRYWLFNITGSAVGDYASVFITNSASAISLSSSKQVLLAVALDADFTYSVLDNIKIEVRDSGSNWIVVHDPSTFNDSAVIAQDGGNGKYALIGMPVHEAASVRGLRVTVASNAIPACVMKVYMIAASGRVPGGAQYALSYEQYDARAESPGAVMRIAEAALEPQGQKTRDSLSLSSQTLLSTNRGRSRSYRLGGTNRQSVFAGAAPMPGFSLPMDPQFYYVYKIPVPAPATISSSSGYFANIYRRDAAETEFLYVSYHQFGEYSGSSWVHKSPWTSSALVQLVEDNTASESRTYNRRMPDGMSVTMPTATAMVFANQRMYASAPRGSGSTKALSCVYASEQGWPYRFRDLVRMRSGNYDIESGYSADINTGNVRALLAVSGQYQDRAAIIAWTENAMYSIDLLDVRTIANVGCVGPNAAVDHNGEIFWVDPNMDVYRYSGGGMSNESAQIVSELTSVPASRSMFVSAYSRKDRMYIAYTPSAGTDNTRALVWNSRIGTWESVDTFQYGHASWVPWTFYNSNKLAFTDISGRHVEFEHGLLDVVDLIPLVVKTKAFHDGFRRNVTLMETEILSTAQNINVTVDRLMSDTTGTQSVMSMFGAGLTWKQCRTSSGAIAGNTDSWGQYKFSGSVSYPFDIYGINAIMSAQRAEVKS